MAISIDWPTKIITIPRADMTLLQSNPTEIRELDLNAFRLEVADLQDNFDGMPFDTVINHIPPITVGGVELARVVEIINGYTVTFEDGQYAVNLKGANSNLADRVNVNQVSVRSSNSAGLVTAAAIEYGEYGGGVTISTSGSVGTIYPKGTERSPVNNIPDALLIAIVRGFNKFFIKGDYTFTTGDDISNRSVIGENPLRTTLTINTGAQTIGSEFRNSTITGVLDGNSLLRDCVVSNLDYINGTLDRCLLSSGTINLGGTVETATFLSCRSSDTGQSTPIIDMNGLSGTETPSLIMRNYSGAIRIKDLTGGAVANVDLDSGVVEIDSSNTNGTIVVRGVGKVIDTSGNHLLSGTYNGSLTLVNEALFGEHLHDMWLIDGLDSNNPVTVTPTARTAGNVNQTISGDGETTSTVTRNP